MGFEELPEGIAASLRSAQFGEWILQHTEFHIEI
jgi:hypothetical protein